MERAAALAVFIAAYALFALLPTRRSLVAVGAAIALLVTRVLSLHEAFHAINWNVIGIFVNALLNDKNFYIYGDGEQCRAFTHIDDFTPYMVKVGLDERCDGEVINIGPREEVTINHLAGLVLSLFYNGREIPEHVLPVYLPPRPMEVRDAYCTDEKARRLLGYHTTIHLEEGIRGMIEWAKELGPQEPKYMEEGLELTTADTPITWTERLI